MYSPDGLIDELLSEFGKRRVSIVDWIWSFHDDAHDQDTLSWYTVHGDVHHVNLAFRWIGWKLQPVGACLRLFADEVISLNLMTEEKKSRWDKWELYARGDHQSSVRKLVGFRDDVVLLTGLLGNCLPMAGYYGGLR